MVEVIINPFRTAVPFGENTIQIPSNLSLKRGCSTERFDGPAKDFLSYRNACAFLFFAARGIPLDSRTGLCAKLYCR